MREIGSNGRKGISEVPMWKVGGRPSNVQGHLEERCLVQSNKCCISIVVTRIQWRYLCERTPEMFLVSCSGVYVS